MQGKPGYNIPIQDEYFFAKTDHNSENLSLEVIKLFFMLNSTEQGKFTTKDSLYKIIFERPCTVTTKEESCFKSL